MLNSWHRQGSWMAKVQPLSVCVLYIVQQRQGYYMQLNNEVGLLHTERVYGKEMDQRDRFS